MPAERTEVVVSVEVDAARPGEAPRRLRLEARFRATASDPGAAELGEAVAALDRDLGEAVRLAGFVPTAPARADRTLSELVETYRPRQAELVELLLAEGEVTAAEADALRGTSPGPSPPVRPSRRRGTRSP